MRLGIRLRFAAAERPHTLPIFGQIRQLQKRAERPHDDPQLFEREACEQLAQLLVGRRLAAGELPGQAADVFDQIERGFAFEATDDVAKHAAQEVDLATELVIGAHGCESSFADVLAACSLAERHERTVSILVG